MVGTASARARAGASRRLTRDLASSTVGRGSRVPKATPSLWSSTPRDWEEPEGGFLPTADEPLARRSGRRLASRRRRRGVRRLAASERDRLDREQIERIGAPLAEADLLERF
jgi:hypothetical protein